MHILDGGLSTELERIGARIDGPLWTGRALLDHPELIEQTHRNFIDAGAELIISSSYQISRRGFRELGRHDREADAALRASVEVARAAVAGTDTLVAASIGPFGAVLHDGSEYRGNYGLSEDDLETFHSERIAVLDAASPDVLLAETIPDLVETRALARALATTTRPVWLSFSSGDGRTLWSGAALRDAVRLAADIPAIAAIGVNCVHPRLVPDLMHEIRQVTDLPIAVYPNRGGIWDATAGHWNDDTPKSLVEWASDWAQLDIAWLGGCCGTDANAIAALAQGVV